MIKRLILLIFTFSTLSTQASHVRGGELTVSIDSNNTAYFFLTLYRDASGITLPTATTVDVTTPAGNSINVTLTRTKAIVIPGGVSSIEASYYEGSTTLNQYGLFTASYSICCRNASISNLANAGADAFFISSSFTSFQATPNNTPVFMNLPVTLFPLDSIWTYNPMPFDPEGDSLYWQIDTPFAAAGQHVTGYTTPSANANGPLTMDPSTGLISWSAKYMGEYQVAVQVEEYRNGQLIGSIIRDMQFTVTSDTSAMRLSVPAIANPNTPVSLLALDPFSLDFNLSIADTSASIGLFATGDAFEIPGSNANFVVKKATGKTITGTFSWTPQPGDVSSEPYLLNVRALSADFSYDYTLSLVVPSAVGIGENPGASSALQIYPNPSAGKISLEAGSIEPGLYILSISDITGKEVYRQASEVWFSGRVNSNLELDLENGIHILTLEGENNTYQAKLIIRN